MLVGTILLRHGARVINLPYLNFVSVTATYSSSLLSTKKSEQGFERSDKENSACLQAGLGSRLITWALGTSIFPKNGSQITSRPKREYASSGIAGEKYMS